MFKNMKKNNKRRKWIAAWRYSRGMSKTPNTILPRGRSGLGSWEPTWNLREQDEILHFFFFFFFSGGRRGWRVGGAGGQKCHPGRGLKGKRVEGEKVQVSIQVKENCRLGKVPFYISMESPPLAKLKPPGCCCCVPRVKPVCVCWGASSSISPAASSSSEKYFSMML